MGADVVIGRFLGPNLLVQTLVCAGNFAQNPFITGPTGQQHPVFLPMEVAHAVQDNTDLQELGLLVRAMTEKAYQDHIGNKDRGGNTYANFLYAIGNPDNRDAAAILGRFRPIPLFNGFEIKPDALKRVLVLRDTIGYTGVEESISGRRFDGEAQPRRYIHNALIEEITDRVAKTAGIDDNTLPLHELIEAVVDQASNAYQMSDGWRRDMAGPYLDRWNVMAKNFEAGQKIIAESIGELAKVPMRGNALRFDDRRTKYAIA